MITQLEFAERVGLALAFGSIIGVERQLRQRMAGLRTNALVATGTSLFIMITPLVGAHDNPTQIAAYVVSGIGFLAGGVIFKERLSVSGLNTAATLWCTAAIGALVGFGFIFQAAVGVAAVLCANVVLRPIVQSINRRPIDGTELLSQLRTSRGVSARRRGADTNDDDRGRPRRRDVAHRRLQRRYRVEFSRRSRRRRERKRFARWPDSNAS